VSGASGKFSNWPPGVVATGFVAGFKEGADAVAHRDTKKQAIFHALTILAGAAAMAWGVHESQETP
jgi:hypothetical protein